MEPINYICYLDTNILLHYTFFTEINWCEALNLKKITLVICPPVLDDLEDEKVTNENKKIKERADKVLKKLRSFLPLGLHSTLRKNVKLELKSDDPKIDWNKENLNPSVKDNHIIAHFISDSRQNKKIITNDITFLVRAKSRGIECLDLPYKYKLEMKDEREKKIERQEKQIEALKRQLDKKPKLQLKILENDHYSKICKIKLKSPPQIQIVKTEEELEKIKTDLLNKEKINKEVKRNTGMGSINVIKFSTYKSLIEDLVAQYKNYFKSYYQFLERYSRIHKLKLILLNMGNWPASDTEIILSFPKNIQILRNKDLPTRQSLLSFISHPSYLYQYGFGSDITKHSIFIELEKKFKKEEEKIGTLIGEKLLNSLKLSEKLNYKMLSWNNIGSRINANIDKLKHNDKAFLDIYIELAKNINTVFSIECEMKTVELPEIIKDKVTVKIEKI